VRYPNLLSAGVVVSSVAAVAGTLGGWFFLPPVLIGHRKRTFGCSLMARWNYIAGLLAARTEQQLSQAIETDLFALQEFGDIGVGFDQCLELGAVLVAQWAGLGPLENDLQLIHAQLDDGRMRLVHADSDSSDRKSRHKG
jgi:hypothetical protein